jgi:O-acetyl-ADP-ribose deacetylase (regulator of RNase III)
MTKPTCFVVMPYGKRSVDGAEIDFDAIYDDFIHPAARAANFEVVRGDRDAASGVIMPRLFTSIYTADLVIADVTYQNSNVYYELGVRHALRPRGTLIIRRVSDDPGAEAKSGAMTETAFDIRGVSIWSYDLTRRGLATAVEDLCRQIGLVFNATGIDSPAFRYLDGLRVETGPPRAHARDDRTYEVLSDAGDPTGRFVGYRAGDIRDLRGPKAVDFWVNSENVLMQMARIYERSVSATIRYLGAVQPDPALPGFDDTIAEDLIRQLAPRHAAEPGEVLVTTSGKLRETHGVKAVLHAATVTSTTGRGFNPISDDLLVETTRKVIATARDLIRSGSPDLAGRSLIMPLFGTGQGRLDPAHLTECLIDEVVRDLAYHAASDGPDVPDLETVLFSAFTEERVKLVQRFFEALVEKSTLRHVVPGAAAERKDGAPTA